MKLCREEAEELCAKSIDKTMEDLTKLEEAVAGAPNTKKDVKDSSKALGISITMMMKYLNVLDKFPSSRDRTNKSQQQIQQYMLQQQQHSQKQQQEHMEQHRQTQEVIKSFQKAQADTLTQLLEIQETLSGTSHQKEPLTWATATGRTKKEKQSKQHQQRQLQQQQRPQPTEKQDSGRNESERTPGTLPTTEVPKTSIGETEEATPTWTEVVRRKRKPARVAKLNPAILVRLDGNEYSEALRKIRASGEVKAASEKIVGITKTKSGDLLERVDRKKELSTLLVDALGKALGDRSLVTEMAQYQKVVVQDLDELQINVNRSRDAQALALQAMTEKKADVLCLSEPNRIPDHPGWIGSTDDKCAMYLSQDLEVLRTGRGAGFV